MQIEKQELEHCKFKIFYNADPEIVKNKEADAIDALRKIAVPGFRPGKAPDYAIKARCKKELFNYIAKEMSAQAYDDVVYETEFKLIGYPQYENVKLDGHNFSCEMTILKKPDFELGGYKEMEVSRPNMDRDIDAQVEKMLHDLQLRYGDVQPFGDEEFVEDGDQITMDFEATIDGESFDGSSAQGQLYTVGSNVYPGFDENILGMMPGDEREFDVTFPESLPKIGGKTAKFKLTLHMGMKRVPAPLTDEVAQKVGLQNVDELKEKVVSVIKNKIEQTEKSLIGNEITKRLVDEHDIKVPQWLLDMEAQSAAAQQNISYSDLDDEEKKVFLDKAEKQIKLSLILDSIRDTEPEAVLSDSEAINSIKMKVAQRGTDPEKFIVEAQKSGRLHGMVSALRDEFAVQWLIDQTKLEKEEKENE